ncbi:hypothetical protein CCP4SC76_3690020 [Gammaproteobacteria bacterium]
MGLLCLRNRSVPSPPNPLSLKGRGGEKFRIQDSPLGGEGWGEGLNGYDHSLSDGFLTLPTRDKTLTILFFILIMGLLISLPVTRSSPGNPSKFEANSS